MWIGYLLTNLGGGVVGKLQLLQRVVCVQVSRTLEDFHQGRAGMCASIRVRQLGEGAA